MLEFSCSREHLSATTLNEQLSVEAPSRQRAATSQRASAHRLGADTQRSHTYRCLHAAVSV